jgi:hypothetical protein
MAPPQKNNTEVAKGEEQEVETPVELAERERRFEEKVNKITKYSHDAVADIGQRTESKAVAAGEEADQKAEEAVEDAGNAFEDDGGREFRAKPLEELGRDSDDNDDDGDELDQKNKDNKKKVPTDFRDKIKGKKDKVVDKVKDSGIGHAAANAKREAVKKKGDESDSEAGDDEATRKQKNEARAAEAKRLVDRVFKAHNVDFDDVDDNGLEDPSIDALMKARVAAQRAAFYEHPDDKPTSLAMKVKGRLRGTFSNAWGWVRSTGTAVPKYTRKGYEAVVGGIFNQDDSAKKSVKAKEGSAEGAKTAPKEGGGVQGTLSRAWGSVRSTAAAVPQYTRKGYEAIAERIFNKDDSAKKSVKAKEGSAEEGAKSAPKEGGVQGTLSRAWGTVRSTVRSTAAAVPQYTRKGYEAIAERIFKKDDSAKKSVKAKEGSAEDGNKAASNEQGQTRPDSKDTMMPNNGDDAADDKKAAGKEANKSEPTNAVESKDDDADRFKPKVDRAKDKVKDVRDKAKIHARDVRDHATEKMHDVLG